MKYKNLAQMQKPLDELKKWRRSGTTCSRVLRPFWHGSRVAGQNGRNLGGPRWRDENEGTRFVAERRLRKPVEGPVGRSSQTGSVDLYIAVLLAVFVVAASIVLASILSSQLRASRDIIASERAFYAANSGVEEALYELVQRNLAGNTEPVTLEGEISYDENQAVYEVEAQLVVSEDQITASPCVQSRADFSGSVRRLILGQSEACEF